VIHHPNKNIWQLYPWRRGQIYNYCNCINWYRMFTTNISNS